MKFFTSFTMKKDLRWIVPLTYLLPILSFLFIVLPAHAVAQRINLKRGQTTLVAVLQQIQDQTKTPYFINGKELASIPIEVDFSPLPLKETMNKVLNKKPVEWLLQEGTLMVREKAVVRSSPQSIDRPIPITQQRILSGIVSDSSGTALENVNIHIKEDASIKVKTNRVGHFSIEITNSAKSLVFNHIGYISKEVPIGLENVINVTLQAVASDIEEVVVVAFGTQKKESVVGAISSISATTLQQNQTRSISNSLGGQTPGIISVQRSGMPGYDNSDFWIRGINTFGANNTPLILIDGIERSLGNISPEEIESFSVLKDAAATALYGVRGANGVILIQTKRGKIGKPRINLKSDFGFLNPTQLPTFVDAATYMEIVNEAFTNSYLQPIYKADRIDSTRNHLDNDLYPDVNWLTEITRFNIPTQRVSMDINGGTDLLKYSLITAYHSEQGMIKHDPKVNYDSQLKLQKYNVRSNIDLRLTNSTNLNVSIGGYIVNRNAPGIGVGEILNRSFNTPPNYHPTMYSNGQIPQVGARYNPWADAVHSGFNKNYQNNIESLVSISQNVGALWEKLQGLTVDARFSFDAYSNANIYRTKTPTTYLAYGRDAEGNLLTTMTTQGQEFLGYGKDASGSRSMYFESKANYEKQINKHSLGAMLLFYLRDYVLNSAGSAIQSLPYRTQGTASRLLYNYDNTYFLEFNVGYNGSENFARGYRFGLFPSVAAGWLISNEEFFQPLHNSINSLKIRGSYGLVGNDQLGGRRFAFLSTIEGRPGYNFGYTGEYGLGGWGEGQFGIPNLTWETAKKFNIGVDLQIFKDFKLTVDYFKERREDIFMQRKTIPETAGFQNMPWANYGIVSNKGVEGNLEYTHRFNEDFAFQVRGNYTFAQNKVIEIDEAETVKNTTRSQTNKPLNQHFGLTAIGLFQADDFTDIENGVLKEGIPQPTFGIVRPGDIMYKDLNADGKIDSYDASPIGKPYIPEIVYGFGFTMQYKNLDLGTFFQGTGNFTNMLAGGTLIPGSGAGGTGNIYANADDRWTIENAAEHPFWPRLSNNTSENNMRASTWWMKNSSFLRMKNLELGYSFNKKNENPGLLKSVRVFFRGSNLVTFSNFKLWDPELGSSSGLSYPLNKIYTVGVDILF